MLQKIVLQCSLVSLVSSLGVGVPSAFGDEEDGSLEEIVVTSRYREENLQTTPLAVTAITSEELKVREFNDSSDIALSIPNASFRPAQGAFGNSMSAYIRGIGQADFDFAFEPGVGVYVDDVYHPTTMGSMMSNGLERVEVCAGHKVHCSAEVRSAEPFV